MSKVSVPQAEGIKFAENSTPSGRTEWNTIGGKPKSIRKRGFWRAYHRKELWAITSPLLSLYCGERFAKVFIDPCVSNYCLYIIWPKEST